MIFGFIVLIYIRFNQMSILLLNKEDFHHPCSLFPNLGAFLAKKGKKRGVLGFFG